MTYSASDCLYGGVAFSLVLAGVGVFAPPSWHGWIFAAIVALCALAFAGAGWAEEQAEETDGNFVDIATKDIVKATGGALTYGEARWYAKVVLLGYEAAGAPEDD